MDLLLNEQVVPKDTVDLNPLNKGGLTPLDLLLLFQSEAGDREIEEILMRSGAKRAKDLHYPTNEAESTSQNPDSSTRQHPRSPAKHMIDYFKYNNSKDSPSNVRNTLLVIAILIATATYQAVLSPPGGVWQDDSKKNNETKSHTAGHSVMGTHNHIAYGLFLFFNSVFLHLFI